MFEQVRMIKELEAELKVLQREAKEEERMGIFGVKLERFEVKSNEAQAMEIKVEIFEADKSRTRQRWK